MDRRGLLRGSTATVLAGLGGWLRASAAESAKVSSGTGRVSRQPVVFVGHGSPMNAIEANPFTQTLGEWGKRLGHPRAVLVISAHWLTEGETAVSIAPTQQLIYDFEGFPDDLYRVTYPARGSPAAAGRAATLVQIARAEGRMRGLDHGAWTVLKHMFPRADVPVFQWSIDITQPARYHHAIGEALADLREEGVLVMGSGNVVHNLRRTARGQQATTRGLTEWADRFDQGVKAAIDVGDVGALINYQRISPGADVAVPFPDHYFPLLFAMGATRSDDRATHVYEGFQAGTLSMRCVEWS